MNLFLVFMSPAIISIIDVTEQTIAHILLMEEIN